MSSAHSDTALLAIENLNVHYHHNHALKDMSLSIGAGELIGVIGPNGAGKTSFIKALCGRLQYTGAVYVRGKKLTHGADRRNHIGLVPQDIGLYAHLSARENLMVMAGLLGLPKSVQNHGVTRAISAVDMGQHEDKLVSALSGGMKRRINVAAAIMHNPQLIIFDEPTAGVDIPARDVVHRLARQLAKDGAAVVLITHELDQAEALCDKVLVLNQGSTLAFDTPAHILSQSFKGAREVVVRFATPPNENVVKGMRPFEFMQGELPTIWRAMTQAAEISFVSAFMTALGAAQVNAAGFDETPDPAQQIPPKVPIIREISVRRPGLTALMHRIEQTGAL